MADEFEEGRADCGAVELAYLAMGEGPLMLCLHGFPDTPHSFVHQLRFFSQRGYRVVAPYMRGYAPSSVPEGPYQQAAFAHDVLGLIDALGHDSAVVYGHDWGSAGAYGAAVLAPRRVSHLIAAAVPYGAAMPRALLTNPEQQRRSWYMFFFQTVLAEMAVPLDDYAFIDRLLQDWSPGGVPHQVAAHAARTLARPGVLKAALGYYRHALNPALNDPALQADEVRIGREPITVPSLYVHGADDGCILASLSDEMPAMFSGPYARTIVQGAGHFVHLEAPQVFNERVLAFLQDANG